MSTRSICALLLAAAGALLLTAGPAAAQLVTFEDFPIDGPQSGTDSPATGTGTVTYDPDTMQMTWNIVYEEDQLLGEHTAAHFHGPADFGESAGIQVPSTGSLPLGSPIVGSTTLTQEQADQLLAELWYVNIHSTEHQGGEIRGQVIPEPATLALLGLGGLAALRRRR